jgi:hypothetical protein
VVSTSDTLSSFPLSFTSSKNQKIQKKNDCLSVPLPSSVVSVSSVVPVVSPSPLSDPFSHHLSDSSSVSSFSFSPFSFLPSSSFSAKPHLAGKKYKASGHVSSDPVSVPLIVRGNSRFAEISVGDVPILALVDTGATFNFLSCDVSGNLPTSTIPPVPLQLIDGSPHTAGAVTRKTLAIPVTFPGSSYSHSTTFYVTSFPNVQGILGIPFLSETKAKIDFESNTLIFPSVYASTSAAPVVEENPTVLSSASIETIETAPETAPSPPPQYADFMDVFSKEGADMLPEERPFDCAIDLIDESKPLPFKPIYNLSPPERKALREYISEYLAKGFIQPSKSPAGFPLFFVDKKDNTLRPCVDYRELNDATIKDRYPLPLIQDLIDRTAGAKIFTKIDLRGAYNLVRIKKGDEWKTAFRTREGLYEYLVMPFGLTNAPAVFQRLMNHIFSDILDVYCICFMDDILIFSPDEELHVKHVREVLSRLRANKLFAKLEKSKFHARSVEFLGFIISENSVSMDPRKIQDIMNWPTPSTVQDVQSFLGLANFYRQFIPHFADIAMPLTELTKKDVPFVWSPLCDDAMAKLRHTLSSEPVLITPDPSLGYTLHTDASDMAIGACLSQERDGILHPVAYYSRKFTVAERNYTIYDKELLAIVEAFKHWRHHLSGASQPTVVLTDHKNLEFFKSAHRLRPRHARWNLDLSEFDFHIRHVSGAANSVADALSRKGVDGPATKTQDITMLPPERWERIGALIHSTVTRSNVDTETDWPLLIAHFLVTDQWPQGLDPPLLQKLRREARHFRLLDSEDLQLVRITKHGTRAYLRHSDRQSTITHVHQYLGHMAVDSIYPHLRRMYWFPKMHSTVTSIIRACPRCQLNLPDANARPAPVQPIPPAPLPFQRWGMDFVGPLPETHGGNKYILTAIDYATRWVVAKAYPNKSARSVAHFMYYEIVMNYGAPREYITDRDKAFLHDALPFYKRFLRAKHLPTTSYHPQTNGMVERMHRTLNHALFTLSQDYVQRWDEFLSQALFALRVRKHSVTGYSPFYLLYGVHPRLPLDTSPPQVALRPLDEIEQMEVRREFHARDLEKLGLARGAASQRTLAQAEAIARRSGLPDVDSAPTHRFKVGDLVKVRLMARNKWQQRWAGPFVVSKLWHSPTYYLMFVHDGKWVDVPINEKRLAPWIEYEPDVVDSGRNEDVEDDLRNLPSEAEEEESGEEGP